MVCTGYNFFFISFFVWRCKQVTCFFIPSQSEELYQGKYLGKLYRLGTSDHNNADMISNAKWTKCCIIFYTAYSVPVKLCVNSSVHWSIDKGNYSENLHIVFSPLKLRSF